METMHQAVGFQGAVGVPGSPGLLGVGRQQVRRGPPHEGQPHEGRGYAHGEEGEEGEAGVSGLS